MSRRRNNNNKPRDNNLLPKLLLTGGIGALVLSLLSRARGAEQRAQTAEQQLAQREELYRGEAKEVATNCLWTFTPELLFEKGLDPLGRKTGGGRGANWGGLWLEIAPLSQVETQIVSNETLVLLSLWSLKTLWINIYATVRNAGDTPLVVREAGNWGWSSPLRISFKFEYLRMKYDKVHDQLVIVLKLGPSLIPTALAATASIIQTFTSFIRRLANRYGYTVDIVTSTNKFTFKKDNVLRNISEGDAQSRKQKAALLQLSRNIKYAHLASPDVIPAVIAMMHDNPGAVQILEYINTRHNVKCGVISMEEEEEEEKKEEQA